MRRANTVLLKLRTFRKREPKFFAQVLTAHTRSIFYELIRAQFENRQTSQRHRNN